MKNTDFLGAELQVGDYVIYPKRYSSSLWLQVGRIVSSSPVKVQGIAANWNDTIFRLMKPAVMQRPDRAVKIPENAVPEKYKATFAVQ